MFERSNTSTVQCKDTVLFDNEVRALQDKV